MTGWHRELSAVLARCRELLAAPDADYTWSSWSDAADALAEIDLMALQVDCGAVPAPGALASAFLPTGPLQEVALSSGWGDEFCTLADRVDAALAKAAAARPADRAVFACCLCGAVAGKIELSGRRRVRIRREGQTSVMYGPVPRKAAAGLRAALGRGDLPAIFAVDLE